MHGDWMNHKGLLFKPLNNCLPSLTFYSLDRDTTLSTDASSYGLGSIHLQKLSDDVWKRVADALCTITSAEHK